MFSDLSTIRNDVKTRLTPLVPTGWRWVEYADTITTASVPTVYLEFTRFSSTVEGGGLARGQVGAEFDVVITDPKTDTKRAEDHVDEHVLRLVHALEHSDDLYWDTGEKKRLPNGQLAWVVSVVALTFTPAPEQE